MPSSLTIEGWTDLAWSVHEDYEWRFLEVESEQQKDEVLRSDQESVSLSGRWVDDEPSQSPDAPRVEALLVALGEKRITYPLGQPRALYAELVNIGVGGAPEQRDAIRSFASGHCFTTLRSRARKPRNPMIRASTRFTATSTSAPIWPMGFAGA